MMRKIESGGATGIRYDYTKLDLYVDYQDPTKFIFTDKSVIPILVFYCDHASVEDIQARVDEVQKKALAEWQKLHKEQTQRERIATIATDKNVNIIVDNTLRYE